MSVDRNSVAAWLGRAATAGGAGVAMLVCCVTTAAIASGGLAAAGGILRTPWLIAAGLVVATLAVADIVVRRTGHRIGGTNRCPPSTTDTDPAASKEPSNR